MKLISSDFKRGTIKLRVESVDDLWYLKGIIESGDLVKARTMRNVFIERKDRMLKIGKRPMTLKIKIERIEFQKHASRLRLTGKIVEGPEDVELGSYHTIDVKPRMVLTITKKEWKKHQLEKLNKAQKDVPEILIAVVDSTRATIGLVKRAGITIVSEFPNPYSIHQEEKMPEFYRMVADEINKHATRATGIILAGPGFAKEHVEKYIRKNHPNLSNKLIIDTVSSASSSGINEVVRRGTIERFTKESEILEETKLIQEFFTHLKKNDGMAIYGLETIRYANELGAIKLLLVSEDRIHEETIEKLGRDVEKKGGIVKIISSTHETGEQFSRMSGLGAILRFKVS